MATSAVPAPSPAPASTGVPAASPWILGRWRDLLLFVATPFLIVPAVIVLRRYISAQTLYTAAALGALGHHLPGMMRAYGDRELFARFRRRFVWAPIGLVALCTAAAFVDSTLSAVVVVTYTWGVWHGLMQTHGFLRIYDGKRGSTDRRTVRLDQAMCLVWFVAGTLFSQAAIHHLLQEFYMAGGPHLGVRGLQVLRQVWIVVLAAVTATFLLNAIQCTRAGRPPSPVKLLLLGTGVAYWWYGNLIVNNVLIGALLFELFHDTQYLAIVWVFNRRRVAGGSRVDAFTRFIFRPRVGLGILYVGLVLGYGSLGLLPDWRFDAANRVFTALLAASALLHFYYDSFIWKVKERSVRASLGLAGGTGDATVRAAWVPTLLRWSLVVVPVLALGLSYTRSGASAIDKMEQLGSDFPAYSLAQHNLGVALAADGRYDGAIEAARRTLALEHEDRGLIEEARSNLGVFLTAAAQQAWSAGDFNRAAHDLREAAAWRPGLAAQLCEDAKHAVSEHRWDDARSAAGCALLLDPQNADARALQARLEGQRGS